MEKKTVKLLLYCTVAKPYLVDRHWEKSLKELLLGEEIKDAIYKTVNFTPYNADRIVDKILNGKIVAEADCELVEEIACELLDNGVGTDVYYYTTNDTDIEELACLDINDLATYLPQKRGGEIVGYAIHLKNVKPFEEPKELSDYYRVGYLRACEEYDSALDTMRGIETYCYGVCCTPPTKIIEEDWKIKNAPQNMCYCEDEDGTLCVLISIKSEWLCKILNGEKTIEVRKSILNALKELIG